MEPRCWQLGGFGMSDVTFLQWNNADTFYECKHNLLQVVLFVAFGSIGVLIMRWIACRLRPCTMDSPEHTAILSLLHIAP